MSTTPPTVPIAPARRSFWQRASIVWIIPVLALVIAVGVAWQSFNDRGPIIRILFSSAEGVKAGQTELKYRDVTVGIVEKVGFSDDLTKVLVDVRLDKEVASFVDTTATFWVVRPEVSARGITGLGTVLSGVFIEGNWDSNPDGVEYEFLGLDSAPLIRSGERGLQIALRASGNTTLGENTPILYRGVEVGRMGQAVISQDGAYTIAEAIIYEPHDQLISKTTRFWDTSGFTFSIGAGGAELDFSSIATLISGGITFETLVSGDEAISDGQVFEVYDDESLAKASVYNASDVEPLELTAIFEDNIAGLAVGAPVELGGFKIGEVTNLNGIVDRTVFGDARVRLRATLAVQPARLGLQGATTPEAALAFLSEQVRRVSLRARLASASILTGGLKVELVETDDGFAATMNTDDGPFPLIPVTKSEITDVSATAEGVFNRINNLPIEDLMGSAITLFETATAFVADENLREAPSEVVGLLEDMRGLVGSDAAQNVPVALNSALSRIETLLVRLDEEKAVARLTTALEAVSVAATKVSEGTETLPALLTEFEALAAKANSLPLNEFLDETRGLIRSANTLVGSDATLALPGEVSIAVQEVAATLSELREERGVTRIVAAIEAVGLAASEISDGSAGLPALVDSANQLLASANELPLETLVTRANNLIATVNGVLGSENVIEIPAALNGALQEVQAVLADLRAEKGVERLLAALDAVGKAAETANLSIAGVPELIERLNVVATNAADLPLNEVADQLSTMLTSANAVLDTQDARELPANLSDALGEFQAVLTELREGGAVENVNKTLQSARIAADQVAVSVQDLPGLIDRMTRLLNQASATLQSYDGRSELNRGARDALRDIAEAAEAVSSLARTLERNPNSLLLGR